MQYPKLRPVNVYPVAYEGKEMICLQDADGIADNTVVVPQNVFFLISMLNGENSIQDLQLAYMRRFGDLLFSDKIQEIIDHLDENLFLEGEHFEAEKERAENEFRKAKTRLLRRQGGDQEYLEPERLRNELRAYYNHPDGPGEVVPEVPPGNLKGLMLPHIDYMRGGPCYAWAYRCLEAFGDIDTFIILGVNHMAAEPLFSVTAKSFETPFGFMEADTAFVEDLIKSCDQDLLEGEFYHKNEHSIELQAMWLKSLFRGEGQVKIVPVLCAGFDHFFEAGISPLQDERVSDFVSGVKDAIATSGKQACLMASVDLSHVGPQFGDEQPVSAVALARIRDADLETAKFIETLDREGFWKNVGMDLNRRNICGLSAIYTFLSILEAGEGKLLKYAQWRDERGWGCVTFASMIFCSGG